MAVNRVPSFVPSLLELIDASRRSITLAPLNLGGASGSGGGTGQPSGGTLGQLIQTLVAYDSTEAATASGSSSLLDNLNHMRMRASGGRILTNRSGGNLSIGSVVVIHTSADNSFETTTVEADLDVLGVLTQTTLSGSQGLVVFNGYAPSVRISGSVSRGDYLYSSSSPSYAVASASGSNLGCFGRVLTSASGSLVSAVIWNPLQATGGGGGGSGNVGTDNLWDAKGDLAAGTGANTAQRLGVGSNGQVLSANSATITGLEWVAGSGSAAMGANGWIPISSTCTYYSADDPTYAFTIPGDQSGTLQVGQRLKWTQTTVRYGLLTKVEYLSGSSLTMVTLYGGTDYDMDNAAISAPNYSPVKSPFGFPADPNKWTVVLSSGSSSAQATPTISVWYNLGTLLMDIPLGVWRTDFSAHNLHSITPTQVMQAQVALSSSGSSVSDTGLETFHVSGADTSLLFHAQRSKVLALTVKTRYYLIARSISPGTILSISFEGQTIPTLVRAESAYL